MARLGETIAAINRLSKATKRTTVHNRSPGRLTEKLGFGPNPGDLRMLYYAPVGLEAGAPLVVVLHGCTQTAEGYAEGAGWLTLADRYGFAVLAPEQRQANNANLCFNWFEPGDTARGAGEAASIRQMVAALTEAHHLDPARVFVTGLSAGGAMTSVMLATYPEVFAGGAIVAGLPYGVANSVQEAFKAMFQPAPRTDAAWADQVRAASRHKGPWPRVSIWHGTADATVKVANADAIAQQWATLHGAGAPVADQIAGHDRLTWTSTHGEPVVEQILLEGLAHGTPLAVGGVDGCGSAGAFLIEAGVSSSLEIARFWGIAGERRAVSNDTPPPRQQPPEPMLGVDLHGVIHRALVAAGLAR
jgi:poly(hydroxyalkanoate) depolymerase family esterase